jgi:hypothetical protein
MQCRVVFMLYRPHGPRVVLSGSESNRVMSGSLDGLPVRPKHSMLVFQIGLGPFSTMPGRARARPNGAGLVPAHLTRAKFSKILCACAHSVSTMAAVELLQAARFPLVDLVLQASATS